MATKRYRFWGAAVLATFLGSVASAFAIAREMPITAVACSLVAIAGACTMGYYVVKFIVRTIARIGAAAVREKE